MAETFGGATYQEYGGTCLTGRDLMQAMFKFADDAKGGDLTFASHTLAAQAMTLDTIFTEMLRRAACSAGTHPDAFDRYMKAAMRAQAQSRTTIEALGKLHQPREQTVRHVHVNEGGQAIIADEFHHHTGGTQNGIAAEQPHAQRAHIAAMPSQNAHGHALPIPSDKGAEAMQDARRK